MLANEDVSQDPNGTSNWAHQQGAVPVLSQEEVFVGQSKRVFPESELEGRTHIKLSAFHTVESTTHAVVERTSLSLQLSEHIDEGRDWSSNEGGAGVNECWVRHLGEQSRSVVGSRELDEVEYAFVDQREANFLSGI